MIEIRNDDRDSLDEIVGNGCYVHLERMAEHKFCLIVDDGARCIMVSLGTGERYRRRVFGVIYEDAESDLCLACLFSRRACRCGTSEGSAVIGGDDGHQ